MEKKIICKNCGSVGFPKKKWRGRRGIEVTFWALPVIILFCIFLNYKTEYNMTVEQFLSYISHPYKEAQITFELSGDTSGFGDLKSLRGFMSNLPQDKILKLLSGQEGTILFVNITFLLLWGTAIIYSIWRWMSRRAVCRSCGAEKDFLIPLETPMGANLLNQCNHESPKVIKKIDLIPQLEKLSELKEKGILTEEEFKVQKQKILLP